MFTSLLLFAACLDDSPPTPTAPIVADQDQAAVARARAAISGLGKTLKGQLVSTMSEQGPVAAMGVCASSAQSLTTTVATDSGVRVGRSSLRLRNPANQAPDWVAKWLEETGERPTEGVDGLGEVVSGPKGRVARVLVPLSIEAPCLNCHGAPENLAPGVRAVLADRYPRDAATGYALGDLRGAMWAETPVGGP